MSKILNVTSEIGNLKEVLVHRPGGELENLTPNYLSEFLFDDIPYLEVARQEHDAFAKIMTDKGIKVIYVEKLMAETIATSDELRNEFISNFLREAKIYDSKTRSFVAAWLIENFNHQGIVDKLIEGIRSKDIPGFDKLSSLASVINSHYPFLTNPLPNTLFTRDPFATVGHGVTINKMYTHLRSRETLMADYIFKYHPKYKNADIPRWYNRDDLAHIEGGDELIINEKTLFIGVSERTEATAIENLAKKLFYTEGVSFERVLAFDIPKTRAFMHLDTVFTQIDHDKFTIHPGIEGSLTVYTLTKGSSGEGSIKISEETDQLDKLLSKILDKKVSLIRCGGGDVIAGDREQWNDGANTLALAPGEVVVYSRNHVTNNLLQDNGIKINVMPSSELSRGRGGPRCMSMPLIRE
ncbi:MAG: arginine deiminase [Spirochaetaceae bacterium]|nr:arginine deiminase [Spirochaetaceae bacterium]